MTIHRSSGWLGFDPECVTGASWVDIEAILDHQVSDTALRARRDEWIDVGVFDRLEAEAPRRLEPYSRVA